MAKPETSPEAGQVRTQAIDARWLREALLVGVHRVTQKRDYINKINVFPVADADTGTNLAFTLHAVMKGIGRHADAHAGALCRRIADLALDGARGNSGAIFAQYLQGFSEVVGDRDKLTVADYTQGALQGAQSAQGAIAEPREGTMLSVIRDYAAELHTQLEAGAKDFETLLDKGLRKARESLANTPQQLEVLRQNNVVDAGAQGFVELLEGMVRYLERGGVEELVLEDLRLEEGDPDGFSAEMDAAHRFCTECIISGQGIDRNALRDRIQDLNASSLVIAGTKQKVRVHVHVDNPGEVFLVCEQFGDVSSQKADDMQQQHGAAHRSRHRVAVVTDTGADIPDELLERLQIHLVPLRINFGDRQYLDKVSLTPDEFYAKFNNGSVHPRTSQPPPGDFRRQFEFLASHFESVVCVSISAALSGTWQAAHGAAGRVDDSRVVVFDTRNASAGHGLLAACAAAAARAGGDLETVLKLLEHMRTRTRTYAVLQDMTYGVRGGRLKAWVKSLADLFRLTPVIANNQDGEISPAGVLLGRGNLPSRFARWVARRTDAATSYRVLIAHCNNPGGARELRRALVATMPKVQTIHVTDAGSALGAHAGPGTLIVGVQPNIEIEDWIDAKGRTDA
ncbi:MAG: DegV family protein [Xanthomonadales bacterium]|nr:DegV family protein [Xanthomonadales bacterium]